MDTPICDFVNRYHKSGVSRLHMPGHKGNALLGCEPLDITEVAGADELYEPQGIIAQSEQNATALFGTAHTFYSTEGSSHCIRAMLRLATEQWDTAKDGPPLILAARNAHKAFITAAALLDLDIAWLWPQQQSLCSCPVSAQQLKQAFAAQTRRPCAVYVTSPDYLGGMQDIAALAVVCQSFGVPLLVDNAHGAYLRFLRPSQHPIGLGATACCDSAHKTLPVLTGGAYLHISTTAPQNYTANARQALALFGSTSPSYLVLQSLDAANRYLAMDYPAKLAQCAEQVALLTAQLQQNGWVVAGQEPLKLTLNAAAAGTTGYAVAQKLRRAAVECEYADPYFVVLMFAPGNKQQDFQRAYEALGQVNYNIGQQLQPHNNTLQAPPVQAMRVRNAMLAPHECIEIEQALGRVCGSPMVSCPPAIPIVSSGELFGEQEIALCRFYGVQKVDVVAK
ncbi:MAG: amino acid decarboxylase [Pygmaiobacter sp.]|nr:amino acid decarboxylase [Pygmaiobacter sp.]